MELSQSTFDELRRLIHRLCGLALAEDKRYLVQHRLEPVVRNSGCQDFDQFLGKLGGSEAVPWQEAIVEAITTQETSFFRDRHPFDALRQHVLPELVTAARTRQSGAAFPRIRLWCAGAATGQEAYSLAILLYEFATAQESASVRPEDFSILATDISTNALATAKAAEYHRWQIARGLSSAELQQFFEPRGDHWAVRPQIRKLVEFRRVNLMQPFSGLGRFDAIFCRNVLIYFDEPTRRRICEQFHAMLADDGWLILGSAENLYGISERFRSLTFAQTLMYRKRQ
jgi:chemotaxis protein methyltransferase CheR